MLSRMLLRSSPWGVLAAGVALGVTASPILRKVLRTTAVKAAKAALMVTDTVKGAGDKVSAGLSGIVTEARTEKENRTDGMRAKARDVGVAAVGTGLAAVDKVKEVAGGVKQKWNGLVAEARDMHDDTAKENAKTVVTPEEGTKREE